MATQSWDDFLDRLADKFRGPVEWIKQEQRQRYLQPVRSAYEALTLPVLDIGSGRGEWLGVLKESEIPAVGIELNPVQAERLQAQGFTVHAGDAIAYLQSEGAARFSAITAFQVVEHWSGPLLWEAIHSAYRGLAPGGLLILETVNVASLWAWNHFLYDPTHTLPLPPDLLQFMVGEAGFQPVEVRYFSPVSDAMRLPSHFGQWDLLNQWLYGPQDYAVLAVRP
jgi:O-antigen chain-terminating methyltransferase